MYLVVAWVDDRKPAINLFVGYGFRSSTQSTLTETFLVKLKCPNDLTQAMKKQN